MSAAATTSSSSADHPAHWWSDLPVDVRRQVLSHCLGQAPSPARNARLVCHELKDDHDALIRHVTVSQHPWDFPFISSFPHLTAIDMSGCSQLLPQGVLAAAMLQMSCIATLRSLSLSTWSIARPSPPFSFPQPQSSHKTPLSSTPPLSSEVAAEPQGPALDPLTLHNRTYHRPWSTSSSSSSSAEELTHVLLVPATLGSLTQLTQFVVKPCPGLISPKPKCQSLPSQIMKLHQLASLQLNSFLPSCHHLRGMPQLRHLLLAAGALTPPEALLAAAGASLAVATGLTNLQLQLLNSNLSYVSAAGLSHLECLLGRQAGPALSTPDCSNTISRQLQDQTRGSSSHSGSSGALTGGAGMDLNSSASSSRGVITSNKTSSSSSSRNDEHCSRTPSATGEAAAAGKGVALRSFELSTASLRHLPNCLSRLTSLHTLVLNYNYLRIEGLDSISRMRQLTRLELSRNVLFELPMSWSALSQLQVLHLAGNGLVEFPPVLLAGTGAQLQQLVLRGNQLLVLPEDLSVLSALTHLDLSSNKLQLLPADLGLQLSRLAHLDLSRNRLQELPSSTSCLRHLTHLDISGNHLDSTPSFLRELRELRHLSAGLNYFKSLACGLEVAGALVSLELPHVASCLPDAGLLFRSLVGLTGLTRLSVSCNQLDSVPPEWEQLTQLKVLLLAHNALASLPPFICSLTSLTHLDISYNRLRALPPSLGQLRLLQQLNSCKNHLKALPYELGALSCLSHLDLTGNDLGALPLGVGRALQRLQVLQLGSNHKLREEGLTELIGLVGLRSVVLPARLAGSAAVLALLAGGKKLMLE